MPHVLVDCLRLHYQRSGHGQPVILVHGSLCQTVTVHEPPLFALLTGTPAAGLFDEVRRRMHRVAELITVGEPERATRMFVDDIGFGPGTWDNVLTPQLRKTFIARAPTWLDQARDPERLALGADHLARIDAPTPDQLRRSRPALVRPGRADPGRGDPRSPAAPHPRMQSRTPPDPPVELAAAITGYAQSR